MYHIYTIKTSRKSRECDYEIKSFPLYSNFFRNGAGLKMNLYWALISIGGETEHLCML